MAVLKIVHTILRAMWGWNGNIAREVVCRDAGFFCVGVVVVWRENALVVAYMVGDHIPHWR